MQLHNFITNIFSLEIIFYISEGNTVLLKCLYFNAVIRRVKGCVNIKLMGIKKVDVFSTLVADTFNENMHSSPSGSSRRFPL